MRSVFVVDNGAPLPGGRRLRGGARGGRGRRQERRLVGALGAGLKCVCPLFFVITGTLEIRDAHPRGGRVSFIGADVRRARRRRLHRAPQRGGAHLHRWRTRLARVHPAPPRHRRSARRHRPKLSYPSSPTGPGRPCLDLWSKRVRYVGVGAMVVGGISSIITVRHGLIRAVDELTASFKGDTGEATTATDRSPKMILDSSIVAIAYRGHLLPLHGRRHHDADDDRDGHVVLLHRGGELHRRLQQSRC